MRRSGGLRRRAKSEIGRKRLENVGDKEREKWTGQKERSGKEGEIHGRQ